MSWLSWWRKPTPAALQPYDDPPARSSTSSCLYDYGHLSPQACAQIYRTQPNIRTVIDFIARNIAQLGVHVFRRVSDLDRVRLADHECADWIDHPNPATTRYKLLQAVMQDLGIYFNAYWLKVRTPERIGLVRLPPESICADGWLLPSSYQWTQADGTKRPLSTRDVVAFHGFDPCNPLLGLSPIETLRHVLDEGAEATTYREAFWRNAARLEGVIERPLTAPKWTPEQKLSWREQWQARYSGQPGQVAVLEDGMTFKQMTQTARDSELVPARKLSREECAAAYHVPLPMVGILEHATFSNVKEQHKQLYQDCLGPWLEFLQLEIERQLLVECSDQKNVYIEFNIAEKLKGSFEEQAASLQTLVGRPVMTANEGRARLNLPMITNDKTADELVRPLNMSAGAPIGTPTVAPEAIAAVVSRTWQKQRAKLEKLPVADRAAAFDVARWDHELTDGLEPLHRAVGLSEGDAAQLSAALATTVNADTLQLLVRGEDAFSSAREAALYGC